MGDPYQIIATILIWVLFVSPSPSTAANSQVIYDMVHNPVEVGSEYYVITDLNFGTGSKRGGLTAEPGPSQECPRYAAQIRNVGVFGMPVIFHTANSSKTQITEDDEVNISFAPLRKFCGGDSGVWNLIVVNDVPYVATNGTLGDLEAEGTWFKIQRVPGKFIPHEYRILHCVLRTPALGLGRDLGLGLNQQVEFCQQLDATQRAPARSIEFLIMYYLSLVSVNQSLAFNGFVFSKAPTIASLPTY